MTRGQALAENMCDGCGRQLGDYPAIVAKGTFCDSICVRWYDAEDTDEDDTTE